MKKLSVPMTRYELILGWIYLVLQLTVLPVLLVAVNLMLGSPLSESEISFALFVVNFVCVIAIFWKFLWGNTKTAFSYTGKTLLAALTGFAAYWTLNLLVGYLILTFFPDFYNVNDDSIGNLMAESPLLITLGTVILVPITEEVLYRGLVFRGLYNHSRVAAYLVSIAVFGALHVVSYIGSFQWYHLLLCFVQYLPAGLCLGWAYAKSNSIWAPILMHMVINLIGMLAMR